MRHLLIALLTCSAATAAAQSGDVTDPILTQGGVRYACTGVGGSSREDPRWKEFPAKLVFAAKDGGYLSEVRVRIADAAGTTVLDLSDCGPWLLAALPKGRYAVSATAHDAQGASYDSSATLTVSGSGQSQAVVRFPGIAG